MTISFIILIGLATIAGIAILNIILLILEWFAAIIIDLVRIARSKPHDLRLILHDVRSIATKVMLSVSFGMDSPKQIVKNNKRMGQIIKGDIDVYLHHHLDKAIKLDLMKYCSKELHRDKSVNRSK